MTGNMGPGTAVTLAAAVSLKRFEYDLNEMRIGKAIDRPRDTGLVPLNVAMARAPRVNTRC